MTDKNYVALHNHSDYSTLDGFATIDEYIKAAKNNNMIGIGLSDHGTASGLYKFITRAQKEGLIPVPGIEFYLAPENPKGAKVKEPIYYGRGGRASKYDLSNGAYTHLTVFAYNNVGLRNLFKLTSISWQPEHFYFKPRIDTNMLAEHAEGLIVTTGCPNSEINRRFLLGQDEKAYEYASRLKSIFGDNFYVELMDHKMPDDEIERIIMPKLIELSKKLNIPPIITNDSHYAFKEDNEPHERILAVSTRSTMKEPRQCDGGTRFSFSTPEYHIKTYEEMLETFPGEFGEKALANTVELTLKCKDIKLEYNPHLRPEIDIPEGYTAPTYFQKLIYEGFKKKRGNEPKEIQEESVKRIRKEFEVIHSNDFISYFLVVHDYINYAHKKGIGVGAGRGSVGGSEIAYVLDISNTDPIRFNLLFERFLSPGRGSLYQIDYVSGESEEIAVSAKKRIYFDNGDDKVVYVHELNPGDVVNYGDNKKVIEDIFVKIPGSAPDIDTDFHTEGREEVVQYCVDKYGEENVANIVTFGTFKAKRAFKAMCTIYNVPFAAANKASSYIPGAQGAEASLEEIMDPTSPRYNEGADFRRATEGEMFEEVVEMASKLDGRISETGVHPCGIIISSEPLAGIIPTQVRQSDGKVITQWEYPELEALGLIKMDMLGLELINTIQQTLENIRLTNESAQGKDEIREIPDMKKLLQGNLDDAKTYKMLQEGNTVGIFQLGSPGVRELLKRAKPTEFMDIATITALYRPGPMSMNSHIEWADRKNGTKEIVYIDERLKGTVVEKILKETEGLCVPKGTLIFDSQLGKYTPIETLRPSVSTTPSLNEKTGEIEEKTVNFVVNTGEKEILEITLANNKTLKVSKTHPVRTIHGYKKAEDLTTNDRIVIVKDKLPRKIKSTLSPEEGWVIGAMMGDGSFSPTPYITTTDKDVMEEFEKFINDKFESDVQINKTTNAKGVTYMSFPKSEELRETNYHDKSKLLQWMENLGIDLTGKCSTKKIPEDLLMNNDEVLLNIIAGLWDTDGCVSESSTNFVTTSKHLFENMKTMLNILGINYTEKISKYENNKTQDRISYRIHPSLYDFKTYIQPYLKVERKRNFPIKIANENKVETGLINFHKDIADSFISKLSEEELETINKGKDKNKPIGLKSISTFIKNKYNVDLKYNKTKVINFLIKNKLIQNETLENLEASKYSVKIKKIENVGYEECYDIEVQDNHNFFIDNMVVSNCIFQEQIMQIATQYAGMTPHEADQLRKAMGKKKISIMNEMHPKFVKGAIENGSTKELAEKIWETMEGFGSYGFNKSHSVSYALNIYEAAYLKAHYPAEFMAAVIQQGFGDPNKVKQYVQEAKRMKLRLGPVDINNSQVQMASTGVSKDNEYDIVFGFSGVKQMNDNLAHEIVEERNANGPYKSVADFVKRVSKRTQLTAAPLSNLAKAGAFDCFNVSRKLVSEKAKMIIDSGTKQADKGVSLFDMLGSSSTVSDVTESIEITGEDYEYNEMIKVEADIIGMYVSGHPTSQLGHIARMYKPTNLQSILSSGGSKETYNVLGTVTQVASKTNRAGNKSIAVLIDDGNDTSASYLPQNIVQSIEKYEEIIRIQRAKEKGVELKETKRSEKMRELLVDDSIKPMEPIEINHPYLFKIKTRGWGDNVNISVVDIIKLDTAPDGSLPYEVNVKNENMIKQIKSILTKHKDKNGAYVKVNLIDGTSMILNTRVKLSLDFIIDMENIVGKENIVTEDI